MSKTRIDFDFLKEKVVIEKELISSSFPRSITALSIYLLAGENREDEETYELLKTIAGDYSSLRPIPLELVEESRQVDFIFDFLEDKGCSLDRTSYLDRNILAKAYALYAYSHATQLAKTCDLSLALNIEAIRGETGAFDERLHGLARPYDNQLVSARNTLRILDGSQLATDEGRFAYGYDTHPRCQDSIAYRAAPQTHGGARDVFGFLKTSIMDCLDKGDGLQEQLRYALDLTMVAFADLGNISERRAFRLNDYNLSYGLPTNLVYKEPGYNHGFPVIQAVGTALLAELKTLSLPTRTYMDEDLNGSLSFVSAVRTVRGLDLLSKILSIEVLMSCQGIDIVKIKLPEFSLGAGTGTAYETVRQRVDTVMENRYMIPEALELDRLIFSGELVSTVEDSIGRLD